MADNFISVKVTSTWLADNQKSLKDAVTLTPVSDHKRNVEDGSLTDMVALDSCILLTPPKEQNGNQDEFSTCSITLQLNRSSPVVISDVVVVSEARVIEVFGAYNEYLSTVSGELLDEMDDTAVYCAEIELNQTTSECTLKFARLQRAGEMWIYGIKLLWKVEDDPDKTNQTLGVNFEMVEERLKEANTPLSNRAESCKQFLKMYNSLSADKKGLSGLPDPMTLLSLLPAATKQGNSLRNSMMQSVAEKFESAARASTGISKLSHGMQGRNVGSSSEEDEKTFCKKCSLNFESVLDEKLKSMENRIMKAFDDKLTALQQQQDRYMETLMQCLMKNCELSVKEVKHQHFHASADETETNTDFKRETYIKQMFDMRDGFSGGNESINVVRVLDDSKDKNILRNALMALKLNELFVETSQQSLIEDRSIPAALKNGS